MRTRTLTVAVASVAATATIAMTSGVAQAADAPYPVTAWEWAPVFATPYPDEGGDPALSNVSAGYSYGANCWTYGDTAQNGSTTSNIWIQLPLNGGGIGYVSALPLTGDQYAGLPDWAQC